MSAGGKRFTFEFIDRHIAKHDQHQIDGDGAVCVKVIDGAQSKGALIPAHNQVFRCALCAPVGFTTCASTIC